MFWKRYMIFVRQMVIFFMENRGFLISRISRRRITSDLNLDRIEGNWLNFYQKKSQNSEVVFLFNCSCCPNSFGVLLKWEFLAIPDLITQFQNHFLNSPIKCKLEKIKYYFCEANLPFLFFYLQNDSSIFSDDFFP